MDRAKRVKMIEAFFREWEISQSLLRPFLTEDAVWWTRFGTLGYENFDIVAPAVAMNLAKPIKFTLRNIVIEGNQAAVEANATATLNSGAEYDQDYSFLLVFAGDKIKVVREYLDTQHAVAVWGSALAVHVPGMAAQGALGNGAQHASG